MYSYYRLIKDINVSYDDRTESRAIAGEIFTYFRPIGDFHQLCNQKGQSCMWAGWTFDKYLEPVIPHYSNMWEDICLNIA